jgi:cell wall-associated NlpC family hydrolase
MDLSYDTRLPVAKVTSSTVEVVVLGGAHRVLRRSVVQLHTWGTSWHPGRAKAVAEARKFLGLQYLWAGMSGFGYDCSGFTYSVLRSMGVTIPRDASRQAVNGTPVAKAQLRPGDLVFFENTAGAVVHVGMYYGLHDGVRSVIHAPRTGVALHITPLSAWSSAQYAGARRYLLS